MKTAVHVDAEVLPDGTLSVGDDVRRRLREAGPGPVTIHLVARRLSAELQKHGVTAEEIDRICKVQLEKWENATRCLLTEGRLAGSRRFALTLRGRR